MKKNRNIFLATLLVLSILSGNSALAVSTGEFSNVISTQTSYYISYDKDGNIIEYNMPTPLISSLDADGTYMTPVQLSRGSRLNVYCGIHPYTDVWRRASSYGFTTTRTVNISTSVTYLGTAFNGGIGISAGVATGFTFTVEVDQSRDSKLEVYCDYNYVLYRGDIYDAYTNQFISSFNYATFTKTAERFLPIYQ